MDVSCLWLYVSVVLTIVLVSVHCSLSQYVSGFPTIIYLHRLSSLVLTRCVQLTILGHYHPLLSCVLQYVFPIPLFSHAIVLLLVLRRAFCIVTNHDFETFHRHPTFSPVDRDVV